MELGQHAAKSRLEAALFGRRKLLGNAELGEAHQGLLDVLQAPLQRCGRGGGGEAGRRLGPQHAQGRAQKLAAVRFVGQAVSGDERQSLTELQAVALHGAQESVLILGGQGA